METAHIVPRWRGPLPGMDSRLNKVLCCLGCNANTGRFDPSDGGPVALGYEQRARYLDAMKDDLIEKNERDQRIHAQMVRDLASATTRDDMRDRLTSQEAPAERREGTPSIGRPRRPFDHVLREPEEHHPGTQASLIDVGVEAAKLGGTLWLIHKIGWVLGLPLFVFLIWIIVKVYFFARAIILHTTGFDIGVSE